MNLDSLFQAFKSKFSEDRIGRGVSTMLCHRELLYFVIDPQKYWVNTHLGISITFGCPGGTVEEGEPFTEALRRELNEEMAVEIDINSSPDTYYVTNLGEVQLHHLEDSDVNPLIVFEHQFVNPEKGASSYLIPIFVSKTKDQPKPSSEIPAIFSTDFQAFQKLNAVMNLTDFYKSYFVISKIQLPTSGYIHPYQSPKIVLNYFQDQLADFLK